MSNIGLLYSTATGIVLRTINPPDTEQGHLTWLQNNLPSGTTLLLLDKTTIGADDNNCPNLDTLIPYVQQNNALILSFGKTCMVVDATNTVVDMVLCCPVLYQKKLDAVALGHTVIEPSVSVVTSKLMYGDIGYIYNPVAKNFTLPTTSTVV